MTVARRMGDGPAFFCIPNQIIDDTVYDPQLPDLLLHGVFEYAFLFRDERSLLLVVYYAFLVSSDPVAAPPVAPCMLSSCSAVGTRIQSLFAGSGTLSACSQAAAVVADHRDEAAAAK
jgi:hypothetical protein